MEAEEIEKLKEGWTLTHHIPSRIKQYPPQKLSIILFSIIAA